MQLGIIPKVNEVERLRAFAARQSEISITATKRVIDTKFTDLEASAIALESATLATDARKAAADLLALTAPFKP